MREKMKKNNQNKKKMLVSLFLATLMIIMTMTAISAETSSSPLIKKVNSEKRNEIDGFSYNGNYKSQGRVSNFLQVCADSNGGCQPGPEGIISLYKNVPLPSIGTLVVDGGRLPNSWIYQGDIGEGGGSHNFSYSSHSSTAQYSIEFSTSSTTTTRIWATGNACTASFGRVGKPHEHEFDDLLMEYWIPIHIDNPGTVSLDKSVLQLNGDFPNPFLPSDPRGPINSDNQLPQHDEPRIDYSEKYLDTANNLEGDRSDLGGYSYRSYAYVQWSIGSYFNFVQEVEMSYKFDVAGVGIFINKPLNEVTPQTVDLNSGNYTLHVTYKYVDELYTNATLRNRAMTSSHNFDLVLKYEAKSSMNEEGNNNQPLQISSSSSSVWQKIQEQQSPIQNLLNIIGVPQTMIKSTPRLLPITTRRVCF
jgi:hypothetical protein